MQNTFNTDPSTVNLTRPAKAMTDAFGGLQEIIKSSVKRLTQETNIPTDKSVITGKCMISGRVVPDYMCAEARQKREDFEADVKKVVSGEILVEQVREAIAAGVGVVLIFGLVVVLAIVVAVALAR